MAVTQTPGLGRREMAGVAWMSWRAELLRRTFDFEVFACVRSGGGGSWCPAVEWMPTSGHAKKLTNVHVTADRMPVPAVVLVHQKGMKEPWCLATSLGSASAREVVDLYSRRFSCEETFRDVKDLRFDMGLSAVRVKRPERRDRLLLVSALAQVLRTLLGAAGESLGMEKGLKANTAKTRTYSLFRQGCMYYQAIPMMREERLLPLVERFAELLHRPPRLPGSSRLHMTGWLRGGPCAGASFAGREGNARCSRMARPPPGASGMPARSCGLHTMLLFGPLAEVVSIERLLQITGVLVLFLGLLAPLHRRLMSFGEPKRPPVESQDLAS
ncbi:hypothetical protein [Myxococcus xanthus]|uniref:hypothetical protein n=1 Tax=Myxococcus xanthus TaxID=34 RepID=UPI001F41FC46|nr:hypothetical protein [Myxococcus xanthus]